MGKECRRWDSNPHGSPHTSLSRARLPFRHFGKDQARHFWPQQRVSILEHEPFVKSAAPTPPGGRMWHAITVPQPGFGETANSLIGVLLRAVSARRQQGNQPGRQVPPRRPEYDEAAAIAAAQQGDLPAFNQIVLQYQGLAYNVAYRILSDADGAADATQDGFIKAFQRIGQYRGGSFRAWLLRIITNTCYDTLRSKKRRPTVSLEKEDEEDDSEYDSTLLDAAERPDEYALRRELAAGIQAAIEQLPEDQRTVLILCDIEGMDYQEIADTTGVALGTVKSRLSRARARLRDLLMAQKELLPPQYRL
jgi:RNA polymerase sigma factor (sigma-70 family)